jgi:hypothetical protein
MRSPALALAWQVWGRHRLGLAVVLLSLLACAGLVQVLPAGTLQPWHAALSSLYFGCALIYLASALAFGFESRVEARESGFPARMFTLPVRTSVLVAWPMFQAVATLALLWAAWAYFVLRPWGIEFPVAMTAALAGALAAVLQALLWVPFGLPWARTTLGLLVVPLLLLAPQIGTSYGATEAGLVGFFATLIPLAYVTALAGVSRARRGEVPDWLWVFQPLRRAAFRPAGQSQSFSTPAQAQLWFEKRRHLLYFPLSVGCLAAFHLAVILWVEPTQEGKIKLGSNFLSFPPVLACFLGCFLGRVGTSAGNPYPLSAFTACRPVTSGALVAAKLKVAALGTLLAWGIVLLAASVWCLGTEASAKLPKLWNLLLQQYPGWKVCAALVLATTCLLVLTWKLLVDNLWIGFTGRPWVFRGSLAAYGLGLWLAAVLITQGIDHPDVAKRLRSALSWWAGAAVVLKLLVAALALRQLVRRRLLEVPTLVKLLGTWLIAAATLFCLAYAVLPADEVSVPLLAFAIVLCLPLARLSAAPLALAWNRHR